MVGHRSLDYNVVSVLLLDARRRLARNAKFRLLFRDGCCRNPTLAKCGGEAQHFQSWGLGVLRDSRMFRVRQKGPKHLALRCSWCHWKGLEA